MDMLLIGGLLVIIITIAIVYTIVKSILKTAIISISIFFVVAAILVGIVYIDGLDVQEKFTKEDKTLVFMYKDNVISGTKGKFLEENQVPQLFSDAKVKEMNDYYLAKNFDLMKSDSYKLINIDFSVFDDITEISLMENTTMNRQEIINAMESKDIRRAIIIKELEKRNNIIYNKLSGAQLEEFNLEINNTLSELSKNSINDDSQMRGAILMSMMQKKTEAAKSIGWLISELKTGKIVIYTESPVFIAAKYLPDSLLIQTN